MAASDRPETKSFVQLLPSAGIARKLIGRLSDRDARIAPSLHSCGTGRRRARKPIDIARTYRWGCQWVLTSAMRASTINLLPQTTRRRGGFRMVEQLVLYVARRARPALCSRRRSRGAAGSGLAGRRSVLPSAREAQPPRGTAEPDDELDAVGWTPPND